MLALLLAWGAFSAPAWAAGGPANNGSTQTAAPALVLPEMIEQIEDLSREQVTSELPPIALPPLPSAPTGRPLGAGSSSDSAAAAGLAGPAVVELPPLPAMSPSVSPAGLPPVSFDAALGAGSQASIHGRLDASSQDQSSIIRFFAVHDSADGISGALPSTGFDTRVDEISADRQGSGFLRDLQVGFTNNETGLQDKSPAYSSRSASSVGLQASLRPDLASWLKVDANLRTDFDSLFLDGAAPLNDGELGAAASINAAASAGAFSLGLGGSASVGAQGEGREGLQALAAGAWDLSAGYDSPGAFSVDLKGGWRAIPYDVRRDVTLSPFILPSPAFNDTGWFADSKASLSLPLSLTLEAGLSFMQSSAMPDIGSTPDPATGLFVLTHRPGLRLRSTLGLGWSDASGASFDARWDRELADRPGFLPLDNLTAEALYVAPSGAFGASLWASFLTGMASPALLPDVSASAFLSVARGARLNVRAEDVLWPALGAPRYSLYPFVDPGFRLTAEVQLSF